MKRAAVYRLLYGEDYIRQSIKAVLPDVDEVFVFWTDRPWGDVTEVIYKGKTVQFPARFDRAIDIVHDMALEHPKIRLIEDWQPTPRNQFTRLVNEWAAADSVVLVEADQVIRDAGEAFDRFEESGEKVSCLKQVEYWKTPEYRIPDRDRPGPIFWHPFLPDTLPNGAPDGDLPRINLFADNYGFAINAETMRWKHLLALAFSPIIGDSIPYEAWYEDVWLAWTPEMRNLEISARHRSSISHAYPTR
jgi:hypothetical protein